MEVNAIKFLEEKYEELKWELTLPMDPTVKQEVVKELENTFATLKYFKDLETKPEEFIAWKP